MSEGPLEERLEKALVGRDKNESAALGYARHLSFGKYTRLAVAGLIIGASFFFGYCFRGCPKEEQHPAAIPSVTFVPAASDPGNAAAAPDTGDADAVQEKQGTYAGELVSKGQADAERASLAQTIDNLKAQVDIYRTEAGKQEQLIKEQRSRSYKYFIGNKGEMESLGEAGKPDSLVYSSSGLEERPIYNLSSQGLMADESGLVVSPDTLKLAIECKGSGAIVAMNYDGSNPVIFRSEQPFPISAENLRPMMSSGTLPKPAWMTQEQLNNEMSLLKKAVVDYYGYYYGYCTTVSLSYSCPCWLSDCELQFLRGFNGAYTSYWRGRRESAELIVPIAYKLNLDQNNMVIREDKEAGKHE